MTEQKKQSRQITKIYDDRDEAENERSSNEGESGAWR